MNDTIARLIASGKAVNAHHVGTGGVFIINAPPGKGIVIYDITVSAFCDLPPGETFSNGEYVSKFSWHQLQVFTGQGSQLFNMRHDLSIVVDDNLGLLTIPNGKTTFDCWINCEKFAVFQLSHPPDFTVWSNNAGKVPNVQEMPPLPFGYGNFPAGADTLTTIDSNAGFFINPLGQISPVLAPFAPTFYELQWVISSDSILYEPQYIIPFGERTVPVVNVSYLIVEGVPTETVKGAI